MLDYTFALPKGFSFSEIDLPGEKSESLKGILAFLQLIS